MRYLRGIGIKGFGSRQVRSLLKRTESTGNRDVRRLLVAPPRAMLHSLNVRWLRKQLTAITAGHPERWVLWTRFPSPELVEATEPMPFRSTIYEPIDRYDASLDFRPAERRRIVKAEAQLLSRATVIAGSAGVAQRFRTAAGGSTWLPFGRDCQASIDAEKPGTKAGQLRIGVVAEFDWRVDERLVAGIAKERPNWQIVLVGPRAKQWGSELGRLKNVVFVGRLEPADVPGQVASFDVALIPYVINDWTRACLPIKVFEYLAEGRPVVSSELPELTPFWDVVDLVPADAFVGAIEKALRTDDAAARERRVNASMRFTLQERAHRSIELLVAKDLMVTAV